MRMLRGTSRGALSGAAVALLALATVALAQSGTDLSWSTVDGGGARSSGSGYTLEGSAGQPDAGTLSGGGYDLQGGFWAIDSTPTPTSTPGPALTPTPTSTPSAVSLSVSHVGPDRLLVAIVSTGTIARINWTPAPNFAVELADGTPLTGGVLILPSNSSQTAFFLRRLSGPGTSVTVPLTVSGSFGVWPTFVGGGPDAW